MRKLLVLVALSGMLAVGWPAAPAGAAFLQIEDPNDQSIAAGDILTARLTHEQTVSVQVTVETPEDPTTDSNWTSETSETFINWILNTDGDAAPEFDVEFFSDAGDLVGLVFEGEDANPRCEGTATYASGVYKVSFDRACLSYPSSIKFSTDLYYDPTPGSGDDTQLDQAPDGGADSTAVAGPPAVDRQVRVGVVGASDNQVWSGHGFGGLYDPMGGQLIAAPAVARIPGAAPEDVATPVFVGTGTDNQLWIRTPSVPWRLLSDTRTHCVGNPAALVYDDTGGGGLRLAVACRGSDNGLWFSNGPITSSSLPKLNSWTPVGGTLIAGPAIGISQQAGDKVTYLVTGVGGRVYQSLGSGYSPTPWVCRDHVAFGSLNDYSWFGCRGTDDGLWVAKNTPSGWQNAFPLGGKLVAGPGVAVTGVGSVFFVQGTDNGVWQTVVQNADNFRTPFTPNGGRVKFGMSATAL